MNGKCGTENAALNVWVKMQDQKKRKYNLSTYVGRMITPLLGRGITHDCELCGKVQYEL